MHRIGEKKVQASVHAYVTCVLKMCLQVPSDASPVPPSLFSFCNSLTKCPGRLARVHCNRGGTIGACMWLVLPGVFQYGPRCRVNAEIKACQQSVDKELRVPNHQQSPNSTQASTSVFPPSPPIHDCCHHGHGG